MTRRATIYCESGGTWHPRLKLIERPLLMVICLHSFIEVVKNNEKLNELNELTTHYEHD